MKELADQTALFFGCTQLTVNGRNRQLPLATTRLGPDWLVPAIAEAGYLTEKTGGFKVDVRPAVATVQFLMRDVRLGRVIDHSYDLHAEEQIRLMAKLRELGGLDKDAECCCSAILLGDGPFDRIGAGSYLAVEVELRGLSPYSAKTPAQLVKELGEWYAREIGAEFISVEPILAKTGRTIYVTATFSGAFLDAAQARKFRVIDAWRNQATDDTQGLWSGIQASALAFGQDLEAIEAAVRARAFCPIGHNGRLKAEYVVKGLDVEAKLTTGFPVSLEYEIPERAKSNLGVAGIADASDLAAVIAAAGLAADFAGILWHP
jgi:hydroxymethylglutaryl-CoA reductase